MNDIITNMKTTKSGIYCITNKINGKRHSDEFKERQRQNKLGKSTWNKGKELTPEHKENLRLAWIRRRERMNNDKTTD